MNSERTAKNQASSLPSLPWTARAQCRCHAVHKPRAGIDNGHAHGFDVGTGQRDALAWRSDNGPGLCETSKSSFKMDQDRLHIVRVNGRHGKLPHEIYNANSWQIGDSLLQAHVGEKEDIQL